MEPNNPFLAMEVKDFPPGRPFNPNDILIDDILKPMVEEKPTPYGKDVQIVENFNSFCPSELVEAKAFMEKKENSVLFYNVRRPRNGKKACRAVKGGRWKARGKYEKITTRTGIKAKKGIFEYRPDDKSEECGFKWIMEEYVLDRGENFEDNALCKLRFPRSWNTKQGEEPLPIENCGQETADTGSCHLLPLDPAGVEWGIWQHPMENDIISLPQI